MKYFIPVSRIGKLDRIVASANKNGSRIVCKKGGKSILNGVDVVVSCGTVVSRNPIKVECVEVSIEGEYVENGWEFVGTIDHLSAGNLIRLANSSFDGKIPSRYYESEQECEHCHTVRPRQQTFLIYSEEAGFKQVGSSCLKGYTNGMDPSKCAEVLSAINSVSDLGKLEIEREYGDRCSPAVYPMTDVRECAYRLVSLEGYDRDLSADRLEKMLREKHSFGKTVKSGVEKVTEYAKSIDSDNNYLLGAKAVWLSDNCNRSAFNLILSFVDCFLKREAEYAKKASSKFVGSAGDRIEFDVASGRILYTSGFFVNGRPMSSYTYELLDKSGNVYILKTGSYHGPDEMRHVKATVMGNGEYNGIKQTKIGRAKLSH